MTTFGYILIIPILILLFCFKVWIAQWLFYIFGFDFMFWTTALVLLAIDLLFGGIWKSRSKR